jgi:hypothetical protein
LFLHQYLSQPALFFGYIAPVLAKFVNCCLQLLYYLQSEFESAQSGMSLCLEVEDLENAIAHLTALGYPPPGQIIIATHGREIYAYDPAGNRLILHQAN